MNNERDVDADLALLLGVCRSCGGFGTADWGDDKRECSRCNGTGQAGPDNVEEIAEYWIGKTKRLQAENAELRELLGEVMARYRRGVQCREFCGDEDGGELGNTVLGVAVDLEDLEHRINAVTD